MKSNHVFRNPNPTKKTDRGDCVVRALSIATERTWDDIFKELCEIGFKLKSMPNDKQTYEEFLKENGFEYRKLSIKRGSKRPRVNEFAKKNKDKVCVLNVANHLVTSKDGKFYDTWDSGECCMYSYWERVSE